MKGRLPLVAVASLASGCTTSPGASRPGIRPLMASLVACLVAAGCFGNTPDPDRQRAPATEAMPRMVALDQEVEGASPVFFDGTLQGPPATGVPVVSSSEPVLDWSCAASQCFVVPIQLEVPAGWWAGRDGGLEFSINTFEALDATDDGRIFDLRLSRAGAVVAEARDINLGASLVLPAAPSGEYVALVHATEGSGPFRGVVQLDYQDRPGPKTELPPNLMVMVPRLFTFDVPDEAPTSTGCRPAEYQQGARRCLRFANLAGNLGPGPLDMHMDAATGLTSIEGEAEWTQRVHRRDGTFREQVVGQGLFHPHHFHMHYEGMMTYRLHAYDLGNDTRGEEVAQGRKVGFCFGDFGLVDLGLIGTAPPEDVAQAISHCFLPQDGDIELFLDVQWFDVYANALEDQYIEVSGLPDGVYELLSIVNPEGKVIESDFSDNEASAVIRIQGESVEFVKGWSQALDRVN